MKLKTKTTWRKACPPQNLSAVPTAQAGWRRVKLGEVSKNFDSKRIPLSSMQRARMKGCYPYYGAAEIVDYVNDYIYDGLYLLIAEDGTVTSNGNRPMLQLVNGKFWVNNHAHVIRGNEDWETKYLFYALRNTPITPYITGAVQLKLTQENLNRIEIPYPENERIRERITGILSAFDDKIELNNKISRTLEQMAQAIFKHWFVDFKFPSHEKVKMVDSELGKIPEGWEVKNIMEIVERLPVGKKYDNRTALPRGRVPILDQGQSGIIGFHNEEPSVKASVKNPVAVFSNHTCYYRLITYDFSCIQNVIPYVGIDSYPTSFVYYLTKNKIKMSDYKGHWPEFAAQKFVVPPKGLAIEFSEEIQPFIELMSKSEQENQKLASLRDLLLPKLMSGEIETGV